MKPPKFPENPQDPEPDDLESEIVAEQIELGYDLQADAAVKAMVSDPASSLPDEVEPN